VAAERTFVLVKPDGVQRAFIGEVIRRFERRGLKIVGLKMVQVKRSLAEEYYAEHRGKPFYPGLMDYITSGPSVAMVVEGKDAVAIVRSMMGATDPSKAQPGTIRGDLSVDISRNILHGSDSPKSAAREVSLFFRLDEVVDYRRIDDEWLTE
jgi:nucleoside-diphosphate kinase